MLRRLIVELEDTKSILKEIEEIYGKEGLMACEIYVSMGYDINNFMEAYQGLYETKEAFGYHLADNLGYFDRLEENGIRSGYFDVKQFTYDKFYCGDYFASDYIPELNGYFIFENV